MTVSCVAAAKYPVLYDYATTVTNLRLYAPYIKAQAEYAKGNMSPDIWPAVKTFGGIPPFEYQNTGTGLFAAEFGGIDTMVCKSGPVWLRNDWTRLLTHPCRRFLWCHSLRRLPFGNASPNGLLEGHASRTSLYLQRVHLLRRFRE